jgi:hypothetical protein
MLAETPTSLAEKRRTMGYLNFSTIDRWFHEKDRMVAEAMVRGATSMA